MARKDWKKVSTFEWKSKYKKLFLVKANDDVYDLWVIKNADGKVVFHFDYETKEEALAYAKKYMRSH
jgi:hypothetical protein